MAKAKKKSSHKKTHKSESKQIQLVIWNPTINKVFMTILIITVVLLAMLTYAQNLQIKQLKYKGSKSIDIVDNFELQIIPLEEFNEQTKTTPSIADIIIYIQNSGYQNIIIQAGFVQGDRVICDTDNICQKETIRFNQRKGKYIEYIYEDMN